MKLNIDIGIDNDAFAVSPSGELARILRQVATDLIMQEEAVSDAQRLDASELLAALYDSNGNCVGACELLA